MLFTARSGLGQEDRKPSDPPPVKTKAHGEAAKEFWGELPFKPLETKPADDKYRQWKISRYNTAVSALDWRYNWLLHRIETSRVDPDTSISAREIEIDRVCVALKRAFEAGLEVQQSPDDRLNFFRIYIDYLIALEQRLTEYAKGGASSGINRYMADRVRYERLDAEIQYHKERKTPESEMPPPPKSQER